MGKDPAVLLYPADFLVGCIGMTDAQIGQYIQLLCIQHQKGHLGESIIMKICGSLDEEVLTKFSKDSDGNWYNVRMDEEKEKRKKHSAQQSINAKKRWDKKSNGISDGNATAMPLETESVNESEVVIKSKSNCLFKNSGVTVTQVADEFARTDDLKNADVKYYFNSAMDWSDNGNMRKDWIATLRSFARRDIRDGKLKLSSYKQQGGSNMNAEQPKFVPSPVTGKEITREQYLENKKAKKDESKIVRNTIGNPQEKG